MQGAKGGRGSKKTDLCHCLYILIIRAPGKDREKKSQNRAMGYQWVTKAAFGGKSTLPKQQR